MWTFIFFGATLVGVAIVLMWLNNPSRLDNISSSSSSEEHDFFEHQWRRRKRLNWLIAVAGLAVILSPVVTLPLMRMIYWIVIALLVMWIVFIALLDLMASYLFLQSLRSRQQATRMALESQYQQQREKIRQARTGIDNNRNEQTDADHKSDG